MLARCCSYFDVGVIGLFYTLSNKYYTLSKIIIIFALSSDLKKLGDQQS